MAGAPPRWHARRQRGRDRTACAFHTRGRTVGRPGSQPVHRRQPRGPPGDVLRPCRRPRTHPAASGGKHPCERDPPREGNRRTGKTSILLASLETPTRCPAGSPSTVRSRMPRVTARRGASARATSTACSREEPAGRSTTPAWRRGSRNFRIVRRTDRSSWRFSVRWIRHSPTNTHSRTFEVYIAAAIQAASPRRVLLMLDEFDKLQEGIDAGITSPQAPENIRHLLQKPRLASRPSSQASRRLKRLPRGVLVRPLRSRLPDRDQRAVGRRCQATGDRTGCRPPGVTCRTRGRPSRGTDLASSVSGAVAL